MHSRADEVVDLGQYRLRNDERLSRCLKQLTACVVIAVISIKNGVKRAGV
jgi:hypothetical protein